MAEEQAREQEFDETGFEDITGSDEPIEEEEQVDESIPEPDPEPAPVEDSEEDAEESVDEQPVGDDSAVDDDDSGEPVDEVMSLREQNEALLKHVESLSGQLINEKLPVMPDAEATPKDQAGALPQTPGELMNFLENTSIDDLLEDPTKFNAVLNQVSKRSTDAAVQSAVRHVLSSVPELVMGYITRHSAMNRMVDDFYRENVDLVDVKQTVAAVANDVHAKNPGLSVEQVFKQSAEATRKLLGLKKQALSAAKRKPAKPAFAKSGGARRPTAAVTAVQQEINDLLSGDF